MHKFSGNGRVWNHDHWAFSVPKVIDNKFGAELVFDYRANKKVWMTVVFFIEWRFRFMKYILATPGQKVVLFLDNCLAHETMQTVQNCFVLLWYISHQKQHWKSSSWIQKLPHIQGFFMDLVTSCMFSLVLKWWKPVSQN